MSRDILCYSLEEVQDATTKAVKDGATNISVRRLSGYWLVTLSNTTAEPVT
jgi:hypothetical protein